MKISVRLVLTAALLFIGTAAPQAPTPLPAQLLSSHVVFLANAGSNAPEVAPYTRMAYDGLYEEIAGSKQFQLATSPDAAQLLLELFVVEFVGPTFQGGSGASAMLQLVIRDPKTHALLWTLSERVDSALREKTAEKNIHASVVKLAADLKALSTNAGTP